MTPVTIRMAGPEDAPALAALKLETFRATFLEEGFAIPYPPADLAIFERESYSLATVAAELDHPGMTTWVAAHDGRLLGYAKVAGCKLPHPDARPEQGELCQLYVRKDAQGLGLGKKLMDTALAHLATHRPGPVWLGVWSGNKKAQHFYQAYGFRKVGDYAFPVGAWRDAEYIYRRD